MQAIGNGPNPHYEGRFDGESDELAALRRRLATENDQMREVLGAINGALNMGFPAAEVLDENSPIRDAMRDVLTHNVKVTGRVTRPEGKTGDCRSR